MSACPICQLSATRLRFNGFTNRDPSDGKVWAVQECPGCGHGWIDPQPTAEELTRYYSETYEAYDAQHGAESDDATVIAKAKASGEFRHIPLPAGKRVLDFGCGGGYFLNICRQLGAEVFGIEPSPHGAALTRKQGIPVFEGSLDEYLAKHGGERFDVITSNHVIEHVPDPVATLRGLRSLLAEGGTMTIAVPNADSTSARQLGAEWHSTDLPFHLHQFSAKSLRHAVAAAGLTVADLSTTTMPGGVAHTLQMVMRRRFKVPQRLSQRLPLQTLGKRIAAKQDAEKRGEALLARLG
jgi:2-polyprenyl-3-methyl-5-hydroxy-6-metoxy-1,4-benzoquinol methylase